MGRPVEYALRAVVGVVHRAPQRLNRAADLVSNGFDCCPLRRVLVLGVEHHAHSAFGNLRRKTSVTSS